ncbi:hypothetical protein [Streptomyces sp. NPDC015125]|uniref:hypothetical protein n=1 Tax=Streptomyces sp. NPDC015125 TaxID=3364938 RepID=UPI0036FA5EC9
MAIHTPSADTHNDIDVPEFMRTEKASDRPNLSLVKPIEGAVVEHQGETLRPAWIDSSKQLATRAQEHAAENRLYIGWSVRGYRNLGRRWLEARRDDFPQMIHSAKAELKAAAGDTAAEAAAKDLVRARRADYRLHKRWHWLKTGGWSAATATSGAVGAATGGLWVDLLMLLGAMTVGAWHGRPSIEPQESAPQATELAAGRVGLVKRDAGPIRGEADLVTALVKAGIISEAQRDETHLTGVIRPDGPGWTATVELPRGAKASAAIGKVADLASALRIKKTRIQMSADSSDEGHEGRFVLWVADRDNPYGTGKTPSPLIAAEQWNFWKDGVPLGADARAVLHTLHLIWSSLLIGGLMNYGKSYLARLIAAAAALDPTMRIIVITGKTGPDWAPLRHIAHQWIAGATPQIIRKALRVMETTISEMQDRGTELDRLFETDPDACPEGKITPEMASNGMGPVLLIVDELQELLDGAALVQVPVEDELDDSDRRAKTRSAKDVMVEFFARYVRVTRFVLGMGVFITQRPDADSVPTKLREVCSKRGSFRVKGDKSAKMVLGDDAVANGAAPHLLGEDSQGVVVLDQGAEEGHVTLKADVIDLPDFTEICRRGRQLRIEAGMLTGDALQYSKASASAQMGATLLGDCLDVLDKANLDRARSERLLELLADFRPERYGQLSKSELQTRLREAGAGNTRKIGAVDNLTNGNGYTREQIASAGASK